jgi:DNA-binding MarR family transcriptional regulator
MQRLANLTAAIEAAALALTTVLNSAGDGDRIPVSPTQLRVLTIVRQNPDINVNGLADELAVVPSSASRLCDRLEAMGLLRREADPRDRREVQLRMTASGVRLLDELSQRRRRALEAILARMPDAARRELLRSLTAFSIAADEHAAGLEDQRSA